MILPKGTLEFQRNGGDDAIDDVIGRIRDNGLTGYLLVLGQIRSGEEETNEITGQLVFKEGGPVLCESVLSNASHKGDEGVPHLLKAMMHPETSIEFKGKIDVEPPIAFFKECNVSGPSVDVEGFKESMREEEEERKRQEEKRLKREKRKDEIGKQVEEWLASGYSLPAFPGIMDKSFEEIADWFGDIDDKISRIKGYLQWLLEIDEVEVEEDKNQLIELMKRPEEMQAVESAVDKFKKKLDEVTGKRKEISKWVNLWKDEGYNTIRVEERMSGDLETAWNAMAEFMDHIQQLKDSREELDGIQKEEGAEGFGAEIRDIEFLLNDPDEIDNIQRLLSNLRKTMDAEKEEKREILSKAKEIEAKRFNISILTESFGERLAQIREKFNLLMNNTLRITEIREELRSLDRRDISDLIDRFLEDTRDPRKLDDYEEKLIELKDRIEGYNVEREKIADELKGLKEKGYLVREVEEKMDLSVEQLRNLMDFFTGKIGELEGLGEKISDMDHRWLEAEFKEVEDAIIDPSRLDWLKEKVADLEERIERREARRQQILKEMEDWEKEGFIVTTLRDVIDGNLPEFEEKYREVSERITGARNVLETLKTLDTRFYQEVSNDLRKRLMDPYYLDEASAALEKLTEDVNKDLETRKSLETRLEELKSDGWSVEGIEGLLEETPDALKERMAELKERVGKLTASLKEIEDWDKLETGWMSSEIDELISQLKKISDYENAMSRFNDLRNTIISRHERREIIRKTLAGWKDAGYIIKPVSEMMDDSMDNLSSAFEELKDRIMGLEALQEEFDSLDSKHFTKEAEEIEFQLNDPNLLDEITQNLADLKMKIEEDLRKRDEFRAKIEEYVNSGYTGATRLNEFLDEDMSIIELEFKNFEKEVETFKTYMEKVGYIFRQEDKKKKN